MGRTESSVCSCSSATSQIVDARVAVHVEEVGAVDYGVPVGEDQNWCSGKLDENFAHVCLHGGRELKVESLPEDGGDRADPLGQFTQEFAICLLYTSPSPRD